MQNVNPEKQYMQKAKTKNEPKQSKTINNTRACTPLNRSLNLKGN